jgi:hypothetical protein
MRAVRLVDWPMRSISSPGLAPASAVSWSGIAQVMQVNVVVGRGECGSQIR